MSKVLTTHVGSLPRSQEVVDFIFARENGDPYDAAAFDAAMTSAVSETVGKQVAAGVDIVSDGETSKISYATYVKDRYTGFDGDSPRNAPADLKQFPSFLKRLSGVRTWPMPPTPVVVGLFLLLRNNERPFIDTPEWPDTNPFSCIYQLHFLISSFHNLADG